MRLLLGWGALSVVLALALEGLARDGAEAFLAEGALLENAQLVLLAGSGLLLAQAARARSSASLGLLAVLPWMALVRELDGWFDQAWHGAWKLPFAALLLPWALAAWRMRSRVSAELGARLQERASGLILAGAWTVLIASRLLGQQRIWSSALGEQYLRVVPRGVEELCELVGYLLLALGALDFAFGRSVGQRAWAP